MGNFNILIVEDDKWYREFLKYHLELNPEYQISELESGDKLRQELNKGVDVVCLDFSLPGKSGQELLKLVKSVAPNTEVIVISGQEDVETAVKLLQEGAYDYIVKNDETTERLWNTIIRIREHLDLKKEVVALQHEVGKKYEGDDNLIGTSPEIETVKNLISKAAETNITVSISGETGTGKEVVAKSIHHSGNLKGKFVAVNVTAIPSELMESELFGHEKGAFTGANSRRIGKFEEANNGTLFLDEIGELDITLQAKLLRVLQEKEITRIGSNKPIKLNLKIITATHRDLQQLVREGKFREDLFFRIMGLPINIAPLRERGEDIITLANHFMNEFCIANKIAVKTLSDDAQAKLKGYGFPGNIRELKALIDLSVVLAENDIIESQHINLMGNSGSIDNLLNQKKSLKEFNAMIVQHFLNKYNKNVVKTAEALDIGKSTIYRMIQAKEITL